MHVQPEPLRRAAPRGRCARTRPRRPSARRGRGPARAARAGAPGCRAARRPPSRAARRACGRARPARRAASAGSDLVPSSASRSRTSAPNGAVAATAIGSRQRAPRTGCGRSFASARAARLVVGAVDDQHAVQVVELVLHDPRGGQLRARARRGSPFASSPSIVTAGRALDRHEHLAQREAALVVDLGLLRALRDDRVDEHAVLALVDEHEHAPQDADLGRREARRPAPRASAPSCARRGAAGRRRPPRPRAPSCAGPGRRTGGSARARSGAAPRARARARAPARDRASSRRGRDRGRARARRASVTSVPASRSAQSDCGSTSTTAARPSRRIAGAAAASSAAARRASARGALSSRRAARDGGRAAAGAAPGRAAARPAGARPRGARRARGAAPRARGPETTTRDEVPERRVAELLAPRELQGEEPRDVVPRRVARTGSRPAGTSGRAPCPGASRPLRPASWVTSWNVRSSARKSGNASPVSASTTAATATPGKWWPLATICVPISAAAREDAKRSSAARSAPGFAAVSASRRIRSRPGHALLELRLEPLRAGADACELDGAALGAARPGAPRE